MVQKLSKFTQAISRVKWSQIGHNGSFVRDPSGFCTRTAFVCDIYVNDLHTDVRQSRVQLYADDTCLYYNAKNATSVETSLNEDLKHISEWLACNKLKLNVQKCEFILFGSKQRLKRLPPNITIN